MAGQIKFLRFSDGTTVTAPSSLTIDIGALASYVDDAAYVASKGSAAAAGDLYFNTTSNLPRFYNGTAWGFVVDENTAQTLDNKTMTNVDINSGTIDGVTIGGVTPADGTFGNLIATGDLTVQGTTTTINTDTLDVEDANITVNKGGDQASANTFDAGITVEMSDATNAKIGYDSTLASKFSIGEIGSEAEIADVSSAQTLTNKTIDADNNTISNLAHGAEVDNPSSGVHGVTGSIVGTSDSQVLTNKTIDADDNTIQDLEITNFKTIPASGDKFLTLRVTDGVPTLQTINDFAVEGTVDGVNDYLLMWDASAGAHRKVLADNIGGGGGGSGEGVFNYVTNPGATTDATTGVTVEASGFSVARGTTEATFSDSYFDISGTATISKKVDWALNTLNEKHDGSLMRFSSRVKLTLGTGTGQPYKIGVHDGTAFVPGTELTLTDGANQHWEALFVLDRSKTYTVQLITITATGNADDDILMDDIIVSPEQVIQGNPSTEGEAYSTVVNLTTNIQAQGGFWHRRNNRMVCEGFVEFSGANTEGTIQLQLPSGYNIDSSLIDGSDSNQTTQSSYRTVGKWNGIISAVSHSGAVVYDYDNDIVYMALADESSAVANTSVNHPFTVNDGTLFSWQFEVPIAEWAGSTTFGANSRVEYAYNSNVSTAQVDTTDFAYGPDGSVVPPVTQTVGASECTRRVRFQTPIQPTDILKLQFKYPSGNWTDLSDFAATVAEFNYNNGKYYGAYLNVINDTDVDFKFGKAGAYLTGAHSSATGGDYGTWASLNSSGVRWRVVKSSNPLGIGAGLATSTSPGAQYEHDVVESALGSDYLSGTSFANTGMSISLTPGVWLINQTITSAISTTTTQNGVVATRLHDGTSGVTGTYIMHWQDLGPTGNQNSKMTQTNSIVLTVNTNTTYTVQAKDISGSATQTIYADGTIISSDIEASTRVSAVRLKKL